jgi:hypothetical protein
MLWFDFEMIFKQKSKNNKKPGLCDRVCIKKILFSTGLFRVNGFYGANISACAAIGANVWINFINITL